MRSQDRQRRQQGEKAVSTDRFIGILLATYCPNEAFLKSQLESIREQTWSRWVCHIVDDASPADTQAMIQRLTLGDDRFVPHFHRENVNSYRNFERGLRYVQKDPSITDIAFADQDDVWHPEKLSTLLAALDRDKTLLAHSDLALIDATGQRLHQSVWQYEGRQPEKLDLTLLLLRNTVTGCTLLFRRELLRHILPFPTQDYPGDWYHDHWIALVACQIGHISHVREPLVEYRQHGNNTVGAQKQTGTIRRELSLLLKKKFRLTRKSYRIHRDLSQAFYHRFYPHSHHAKLNPFSDEHWDFGLRILRLGLRSLLSGYGAEGITLRLVVNKFVFDALRVRDKLFNAPR